MWHLHISRGCHSLCSSNSRNTRGSSVQLSVCRQQPRGPGCNAKGCSCCRATAAPDFSDSTSGAPPEDHPVLITDEEGVVLYPLAPNQPSSRKLMAAIKAAPSIQQLHDLLTKYGPWYRQTHLTATFNSLVRQLRDVNSDPKQLPPAVQALVSSVLQLLGTALVQQADDLDAQALANALLSCSKLGHRDPQLLTCLLEVTAVKLDEFTDQNISMLLDALVGLSWRPDPVLVQLLMPHLEQHAYKFCNQSLANSAWALAKLQLQPPPRTMSALLQRCQQRMLTFNTQHFSMVVWGLAKHHAPLEEQFVEVLLHRAGQLVPQMSSKDLAFWLWGSATLEVLLPPELLTACCQRGLLLLSRTSRVAAVHMLFGLARQRQLRRRSSDIVAAGAPSIHPDGRARSGSSRQQQQPEYSSTVASPQAPELPTGGAGVGDANAAAAQQQVREQLVTGLLQLLEPQLCELDGKQLTSVVLSTTELAGHHWTGPADSNAGPASANVGPPASQNFKKPAQSAQGTPGGSAELPVLQQLPHGWLPACQAAIQQNSGQQQGKAWEHAAAALLALQQTSVT